MNLPWTQINRETNQRRIRQAIKIFSEHHLDQWHEHHKRHAWFRLCGKKKLGEHYEVIVHPWGRIICHGDWEPVIFQSGDFSSWQDALAWIGKEHADNEVIYLDYPLQKATIGTDVEFEHQDEKCTRRWLLAMRREKYISYEECREALEDIENNPLDLICAKMGELPSPPTLYSWRFLIAWAAVHRVLQLTHGDMSQCVITS